VHRTLALGGAVLVATIAFAAPAMADTITPIALSFNNVVLDTPATGDAALVSPSTQPLNVTADVDITTGAFTVAPSDFSAPTYTFTAPTPGTATVTLDGPATGAVDLATGALTLTADFQATITANDIGSCTIDTGPETLTTATTLPLPGLSFPVGVTGFITGDGAFGVGWSSLPAGTGTVCALLNSAIDGPGGLYIARTTPPELAVTLAGPKFVKVGTTATVAVTLANAGGADTSAVKVCLAARKPLSPTRRCVMVATQNANATTKVAFKLKTTKAKPGTYRLTVSTTGLAAKTFGLKIVKK
jgi:hypothetical protein